ncbi:MAG: hypothetical protein HWE16_19195 [Gammaproteobacteria bacterium]|nr:hypothetical protein [Gammaproteobacteria bacterium]
MSYLGIIFSIMSSAQISSLNVCENLELPKQIDQLSLFQLMQLIPASEQGKLSHVHFSSYEPIESLDCSHLEDVSKSWCEQRLLMYEAMCKGREDKNNECKLFTLFAYDGVGLSFTQSHPSNTNAYKFYMKNNQWQLAGQMKFNQSHGSKGVCEKP